MFPACNGQISMLFYLSSAECLGKSVCQDMWNKAANNLRIGTELKVEATNPLFQLDYTSPGTDQKLNQREEFKSFRGKFQDARSVFSRIYLPCLNTNLSVRKKNRKLTVTHLMEILLIPDVLWHGCKISRFHAVDFTLRFENWIITWSQFQGLSVSVTWQTYVFNWTCGEWISTRIALVSDALR